MIEAQPAVLASTPAPSAPGSTLLVVRGADARSFLDSQLTRNVPSDGIASIAGYCSPKGRLLATFIVWSEADTIHLLIANDLAETIAKRLRMYVLRAKAVIDIARDRVVEYCIEAAGAPSLSVWSTVADGEATWIRYPDVDGRARHVRVDVAGRASSPASIDAATWHWLDIRSGLPTIHRATQERFVPQMVNLEALGGVDFRKGCFPGQEVVARSQYLGKLKRRTALGSTGAECSIAAGDDVWQAGDAEPIGLVVDAERGPDRRFALLVELPVAAFASRTLTIGAHGGPAITLDALPYVLPDNDVFVRPKL